MFAASWFLEGYDHFQRVTLRLPRGEVKCLAGTFYALCVWMNCSLNQSLCTIVMQRGGVREWLSVFIMYVAECTV